MPALRFLLALAGVVALHFVGARLSTDLPRVLDLFLVLVVVYGLRGDLFIGLAVGLVAGLVTDAVTGGLYGLHGFADTMVGYGAAYAAQRLVIRRAPGVFLMFALAAAAQQAILVGLVVMLLADPALPDLTWMLIKVAATGLIGMLFMAIRRRSTKRLEAWKRTRTSKLK